MNEEEKSEVAHRMQHIDHHMYLDETSSKEGPPDPEEHPDKIVYAPVKPVKHEESTEAVNK